MGTVVKLVQWVACEGCGAASDPRKLIWIPSLCELRELAFCAMCVARTFPDHEAGDVPPEASKLVQWVACEGCGAASDPRKLIWIPSLCELRELAFCAMCVARTFPDHEAGDVPPEAS